MRSDRAMGLAVFLIIGLYAFIHLFKLEVYPLYMYAMFSKQETPREHYYNYDIYVGDAELKWEDWDYRKYTYLMNTIQQYDAILQNDLLHPEAEVIRKFMDRLRLNKTTLASKAIQKFRYSESDLKLEMGIWLHDFLKRKNDLQVIRNTYNWTNDSPVFVGKTTIYEDH